MNTQLVFEPTSPQSFEKATAAANELKEGLEGMGEVHTFDITIRTVAELDMPKPAFTAGDDDAGEE